MAKSGVEFGDKAPEFTVEGHDGGAFALGDYLGKKVVVLYFYPKDGTPTCTAEACAFRDSFEDFAQAGAVVVGVSADSLAKHREFAERQRLPFTLLSDGDGKLRKLFGVKSVLWTVPWRVTFVIDKQGVVRHKFSALFEGDKHVREALAIVRQLAAEA